MIVAMNIYLDRSCQFAAVYAHTLSRFSVQQIIQVYYPFVIFLNEVYWHRR